MQEPEKLKHPAAEAVLFDSFLEDSRLHNVVPDIFKFKSTLILHTGNKPYHPANRRISLFVRARDLQARYGLSEDALQLACQVQNASLDKRRLCISAACMLNYNSAPLQPVYTSPACDHK